jgi:hypothetical protein
LHLIVPFPSFDINIIVDVSCGVSVFYGHWFSTVFLAFPVLVRPKTLSLGVSSPPILSAEQRHNAPKFQFFPLVISI